VAIHSRYIPKMPYWVAALLVVSFITLLNLRGIKSSATANIVGAIWFSVGFTYLAVTTKGFRIQRKMIDFSES
jgi:amino acid transporter